MDWNCGWCRLCDCRLLLDTEVHSWVSLQAPFYLLEHKLCRNLTNFSRKIAKNMFAYNYWYIRTVVARLKCVWFFFICRQNVKMVYLRRCAVYQVFTVVKRKSDNRKCSFVALCRLYLQNIKQVYRGLWAHYGLCRIQSYHSINLQGWQRWVALIISSIFYIRL